MECSGRWSGAHPYIGIRFEAEPSRLRFFNSRNLPLAVLANLCYNTNKRARKAVTPWQERNSISQST